MVSRRRELVEKLCAASHADKRPFAAASLLFAWQGASCSAVLFACRYAARPPGAGHVPWLVPPAERMGFRALLFFPSSSSRASAYLYRLSVAVTCAACDLGGSIPVCTLLTAPSKHGQKFSQQASQGGDSSERRGKAALKSSAARVYTAGTAATYLAAGQDRRWRGRRGVASVGGSSPPPHNRSGRAWPSLCASWQLPAWPPARTSSVQPALGDFLEPL